MGFPGRPWASLASVRAGMALGLVALLLVGLGASWARRPPLTLSFRTLGPQGLNLMLAV
jgi:hypothetical protein